MKTLKKNWWLVLLRGIVLISLGFLIVGNPMDALVGMGIYLSITLLFTGIMQVIGALSTRKVFNNWGWSLTIGIIDIVFGFILLSSPGITAITLPFVVGFWIIISGLMTFLESFNFKKTGVKNWWFGLISGVLSVIVGFIITNNLLVGTLAISIWVGVGFILSGLFNTNIAFKLKSLKF
ncbi:DUF308 domain-containing protein [Tamlana fucoidanivorans]|uniref:HdeD family acid-resistance protein n=1 Tax=Allotamlana fucoidanivorans TaxID=2583814 RepID=A0A5C4SQ84_9FLAO|nr:DUF308 domain-containing protein [Tamlana fucoidanivorans]TNJ45636.1 hypothetical protein FGF67_04445 [Tamlana fucoidanivorans]